MLTEPPLSEDTAAAWTVRAQAVTVRRLVAEVDWSLDRWDAHPAADGPPGPPPAGHDLAGDFGDAARQMRARQQQSSAEDEREMRARRDGPEWSPADAEIAFAGPASVVTLAGWEQRT